MFTFKDLGFFVKSLQGLVTDKTWIKRNLWSFDAKYYMTNLVKWIWIIFFAKENGFEFQLMFLRWTDVSSLTRSLTRYKHYAHLIFDRSIEFWFKFLYTWKQTRRFARAIQFFSGNFSYLILINCIYKILIFNKIYLF